MADRIVVMDAGRIAQVGAPKEVFDRPNSPFVASFMGADNTHRSRGRAGSRQRASRSAPATRRAISWSGAAPVGPRDGLFPRRRRDARRSERAHRRRHRAAGTDYAREPIRADITAMRVAIGDRHFTVTDDALPRPRYAQSACACRWRRCTCSPSATMTREELMRRTLIAAALAAAVAGVAGRRARRRSTSRPPATRTWSTTSRTISGPKFEKIASRREGASPSAPAPATAARRRSTRSSTRRRRPAPRTRTSTSSSSTRRPPARW